MSDRETLKERGSRRRIQVSVRDRFLFSYREFSLFCDVNETSKSDDNNHHHKEKHTQQQRRWWNGVVVVDVLLVADVSLYL